MEHIVNKIHVVVIGIRGMQDWWLGSFMSRFVCILKAAEDFSITAKEMPKTTPSTNHKTSIHQ